MSGRSRTYLYRDERGTAWRVSRREALDRVVRDQIRLGDVVPSHVLAAVPCGFCLTHVHFVWRERVTRRGAP